MQAVHEPQGHHLLVQQKLKEQVQPGLSDPSECDPGRGAGGFSLGGNQLIFSSSKRAHLK